MSEASEREAFEAWAQGERLAMNRHRHSYADTATAWCWDAWQERARRAPTSEPAPVAAEPDSLVETARKIVRATGRASISLLQLHLRIGYIRAMRLLESLESEGTVSAADNTGVRSVLTMPAEPDSSWISAKERLPEADGVFLVSYSREHRSKPPKVLAVLFSGGSWRFVLGVGQEERSPDRVTHWMPMPAAPDAANPSASS